MSTRRGKIKTILTIVIPMLLLLAVILLAVFLSPGNTCKTDACEKEASRLINSMNTSADPCEDFYQFTCGNTLREINQKSLFKQLEQQGHEDFIKLYKESIKDNDHEIVKFSKRLFQKCLNNDETERENLRRIKDVINDVGGWPVLDSRLVNPSFDWLQAIYRLRDLGYPFSIFFDVTVRRKTDSSGKYILQVYKKNIIDEHSIMNKYSEKEASAMMAKVATAIGSNDETYSLREMKHVLDFNNLLSRVPNEYVPFPERYTIQQLQQEYNGFRSMPFDWLAFINRILGPEVRLSPTDYVASSHPSILNEWVNLISRSSNKTVANYMIWKVIEAQLPYLPENVRAAAKYKINDTREMFCLEECEKRFSVSPIRLTYAKETLPLDKAKQLEQIFTDIKLQFVEDVEKSKSLEAKDKIKIKELTDQIVVRHELAEDYVDDLTLDRLNVSLLPITSETFLDLLAQANRNYQTFLYKQLNNNISDTKVSSPKYYINLPELVLPTELINFLQEEKPNYRKYPFVGSFMEDYFYAILEEIAPKSYELVSKCWLDQMNGVTGEIIPVIQKGLIISIAEKVSYEAYEKWIQIHGDERKLPGLDYTPRQLFWITGISCHELSDPNLFSYSTSTLVSKINNPYFAKDFNCPVGSRTNPQNKCSFVL